MKDPVEVELGVATAELVFETLLVVFEALVVVFEMLVVFEVLLATTDDEAVTTTGGVDEVPKTLSLFEPPQNCVASPGHAIVQPDVAGTAPGFKLDPHQHSPPYSTPNKEVFLVSMQNLPHICGVMSV